MRADPAVVNILNRHRVQMIPAFAAATFGDDQPRLLQHPQMHHHGGAIEFGEAAGELAGGDEMNVYTMFPVSVGADGDGTDVLLAVSWESFSAFGEWWDAYPSSDVAQMERETMTCHGSALWESEEI